MSWWADAARVFWEAWRETVTFPLVTLRPPPPAPEEDGKTYTHVLEPRDYQAQGRNCIYPPHPKSGRVYSPGRLYGEGEESER